MITKEDLARIKFEIFNDLEDEITSIIRDRQGDEIDGMEALLTLTDCCIRVWSRQEFLATQELDSED